MFKIQWVIMVLLLALCGCYVAADQYEYERLAQLAQSLMALEQRIQGKDLKLDAELSQVMGMILSVANQDLAEYVKLASRYNAQRPNADNPLRPYLWLRNRLTTLPSHFASPLDESTR
ncbi:MAG TPA: hypothetical protein VES89_08715 [Candidatus Competibacteraceae bacterium]|nr:hypothetical protein [Candidatus Competibacteraceae bacterium]